MTMVVDSTAMDCDAAMSCADTAESFKFVTPSKSKRPRSPGTSPSSSPFGRPHVRQKTSTILARFSTIALSDDLSDVDHAALDKDVLQLQLSLPLDLENAATLLTWIVHYSAGKLDHRYVYLPLARDLVSANHELKEALETAWATKSFKTIRNLPMLRSSDAPIRPS